LWSGTAGANQYIELKGARFPTQQAAESSLLKLQGAGLLKWGIWFDVYAAAYYEGESSPQNRKLVIEYFMPIEVGQIRSAAEAHLSKQLEPEQFAQLKPALDRLHAAMQDVTQGDRYALILNADRELILKRNEAEVLRLNEPGLGEAYLNMWLGEDPLDKKLRLSLLGIENPS
jgi:hypothetical protein